MYFVQDIYFSSWIYNNKPSISPPALSHAPGQIPWQLTIRLLDVDSWDHFGYWWSCKFEVRWVTLLDDMLSMDGDTDSAKEAGVNKGLNLGILCLCLPIRMTPFLWEGSYVDIVCRVVCCMAMRLGQWRKSEFGLWQVGMSMIGSMCGDQWCADPQIFSPRLSMDPDRRSLSAEVLQSAVSPHPLNSLCIANCRGS